jgi:AcrR family transcriptional regulator
LSVTRTRRGNTREHIQHVALDLFVERGYEQTSLREISDQLGLTKAALYYHFPTKEAILVSLFEDVSRPLDEVIAWGKGQPKTLATKRELLRRYSAAIHVAEPLFRFMQDNEATLRKLSIGQTFKERMAQMSALMVDADAEIIHQASCLSALFTVHFGMIAETHLAADPDAVREAFLRVGLSQLDARYLPQGV